MTPVPTTIGELIQGQQQAEANEAASKAAAEAAIQVYSRAQEAAVASRAQLKAGLGKTGPIYVQDASGSVEIYLPDASNTGYSVIRPAASTTPVDLTAPAPAPAAPDAPPSPPLAAPASA